MGPATLLGKNCRRTLLGSLCKLNLSVNGSPLILKSVNLEAHRDLVSTYPDVMAAAMWSPTLLRHELLGSHLSKIYITHQVLRVEKAIDWGSVSRESGGLVNSLVATEGGIEKEW